VDIIQRLYTTELAVGQGRAKCSRCASSVANARLACTMSTTWSADAIHIIYRSSCLTSAILWHASKPSNHNARTITRFLYFTTYIACTPSNSCLPTTSHYKGSIKINTVTGQISHLNEYLYVNKLQWRKPSSFYRYLLSFIYWCLLMYFSNILILWSWKRIKKISWMDKVSNKHINETRKMLNAIGSMFRDMMNYYVTLWTEE